MKIEKSLKKIVDELIETKQINMNIADMLLTVFPYEDIITKKGINNQIEQGFNEKEAIFNVVLEYFGISEDDDESIEIAKKYIYENLVECSPKDYLENPYVKAIKPKAFKNNGYELSYLKYAPYQIFPNDEVIVNEFPYEEIYRLGYFKNEFNYLALMKNDEIWMSVNPNEINTMKPYITESNGNVLVLGLGMGYIAYMMSLKSEVKSVTIVEKDINIINVFKTNLFPLFANKNKIKIVHDDAFRYLENNKGFDYVFADLWHNPEDGIPMYLQLENIAKKQGIKINYWLEPSLKAMKRRCILTILEEYYMGYTEKEYQYAKNPMDQTINYLYKQIKNIEINTVEELKKLLD